MTRWPWPPLWAGGLLACAPDDPLPIVVPSADSVEHDLRIDLVPGLWPNRLPATGSVEIAAVTTDTIDALALVDVRLVTWDRVVHVPITGPLTQRDVDGDGRVDAVWTVDVTDVEALLTAPSGRVWVEGTVDGADASGWDALITADAPITVLPTPTGPHRVGTLLTSSDGTDRDDPLTTTTRPRTLPVQVWFPTDAPGEAQPAVSYLNLAEAHLAAAFFGLPEDHFDRVIGHAVIGYPVADRLPIDPWPVVLLTPGDGPIAAHSALASELASHGFVVVGLNPPFSGIPVLLADGTDATAPVRTDPVTHDEVVAVWVDDVDQLLGTVSDWTSSDLRFEELLSTDRVAHVGVGLGGAASIASCHAHNALLACVDLDGTPLESSTEGKTGQPLLLVSTASRLLDEPTRKAVLDRTLAPSWSVELSASGPDALWDLGLHGDLVSSVPVDVGTLPPDEAFAAAAAYTVDFLDRFLRDGDGAFLDAGSTDVATVTSWASDNGERAPGPTPR